MGKHGNSVRLYFLGSKITADGDCRHEIKRCLLLGRKVMTNLLLSHFSCDQPRQHIKKQRHYLANKSWYSQSYGFSSSHYGCESWTIKKAEGRRIDAFELWCWRRLLRVPWTARRPIQSILKDIFIGRTDAEAETPILWPPDMKNWLFRKDLDAGKDWRWEEKRMIEDEMAGWHHRFNGHGFGWTPEVGDG